MDGQFHNNLQSLRWSLDDHMACNSLAEFAKQAWHVLEPGTELKWGWALDAICEHLEAVTRGEITRLLMNVPPGCMKSLLTGVMWPAWEWGPKNIPFHRYLGCSHSIDLAMRDNVKCNDLIQSEWYQKRWPVNILRGRDAKKQFANDKTGFRQCVAFKNTTGNRASRILLDDVLSVSGADSDKVLLATARAFSEAIPTRVMNEKSAIIAIMQRLHELDISGVILERELGYTHLCLPMRLEQDRKCYTNIGFEDPRKEEGELLFPDRFPEETVSELERSLGTHATAGQLQQRPTPREGGLFKVKNINIIDVIPECHSFVRRWDLGSTQGSGDYTAGVLIGSRKDGGGFVVLDVQHFQKGPASVREAIYKTAEADKERGKVLLMLPQDPAQAGKVQKDSMLQFLAEFAPRFERETGSKTARAEPFSVQVEQGRVSLVKAHWNRGFLDELATFPMAAHDDQVDAASGAFNSCARRNAAPKVLITK